MTDESPVYERLADRLSRTPNGFPRSESGVELKLLAKMFTPVQAALAAVMHLHREDVADIARRAGVDTKAARVTLKAMARRGLVRAGRGEGGLSFGLLPFAVGSYEESLPYFDEEMAELFEALMRESRGVGMLDEAPALQRIIPVEQSVDAEIEVLPYEGASELLNAAKSLGVQECICRKQKALIGERCDYPMENCIVFAPVEGAFANLPHVRAIDREEAFRILREAEDAGLVHSVYNQQQRVYYICNCCPCCCGIMRGMMEFGHRHALARSDFLAQVDEDVCDGCEMCVDRCHFGALSVPGDVCVVDPMQCMGCGLCVSECPNDALDLVRRPEEERIPPPVDHKAWMAERAASRGASLEELL